MQRVRVYVASVDWAWPKLRVGNVIFFVIVARAFVFCNDLTRNTLLILLSYFFLVGAPEDELW